MQGKLKRARKIWVPCSNPSRSYKEPTPLLQGKLAGYAIGVSACQKLVRRTL